MNRDDPMTVSQSLLTTTIRGSNLKKFFLKCPGIADLPTARFKESQNQIKQFRKALIRCFKFESLVNSLTTPKIDKMRSLGKFIPPDTHQNIF